MGKPESLASHRESVIDRERQRVTKIRVYGWVKFDIRNCIYKRGFRYIVGSGYRYHSHHPILELIKQWIVCVLPKLTWLS